MKQGTSKIRVMIIEDSRVVREFLEYLIGHDQRLEVAAAVATAEEAIGLLHEVSPDVISMDIRLPGMNGFEATKRIMSDKPTPIVVVSASVEAEDLKITMNALRAGALSVVEKPVGVAHADYEGLADRLCTQLAIMSQVRVIRQRADRGPRIRKSLNPSASRVGQSAFVGQGRVRCGPYRMIGIVASTGGPGSLEKVLKHLPSDFPLPILLVQHITAGFMKGFVSWLDSVCPLHVLAAAHGQTPQPGHLYVAPADHHLRLEGNTLKLDTVEPIGLHRPSGTLLLQSMAQSLGRQAIGIVLTGMGGDGAEGLRQIRDRGGYTIAEDQSTAVVYGMPAVAMRLGAVCESLPLTSIAPRLLGLCLAKEFAT